MILGALLWTGLAQAVLCEEDYRSLRLGSRHQEPLVPLAESTSGLVKQIEGVFKRFRGDSVSLPDRFTCPNGRCIVVSETLQQALRAVGIVTQRLVVADSLVVSEKGAKRRILFNHYFLIIEGNKGREEIIIDSSYRQFMPEAARENFPEVFVGTSDMLVEVYRQSQLGIEKNREGQDGYRYGTPEYLVDHIFGIGSNSAKRFLDPGQ